MNLLLFVKMNTETETIFMLNALETPQSGAHHKFELPVPPAPLQPVNLENVCDFSNVCRLCAAITEYIIPMFSGEGMQASLADKINKHLPIHVSEKDMLPQVVCYQCSGTLLAWHELVTCCQQADDALRTRLAQMQPQTHAPQDVAVEEPNQEQESQSLQIKKPNEYKPCHVKGETPSDTGSNYDDFPQTSEDDDDQPLSAIANKPSQLFHNFYTALVNFRNHFDKEHRPQKYPDLTDSSDSETVAADYDQNNFENFDDLTDKNMRKDKMDDETKKELSEVLTKINGKVFYTCRNCGKNLSSPHTYVFHKRIHTGERPCVCHICGKQFRAPNGLQRHLTETHEKSRRHSCKCCSKTFANTQNLKQHMRIHTGERPFVCPYCGKRFAQSGSLHVHVKIHSDTFPYQCADCGAKFRLRAGLARHKLKHTGERPHACQCGKAFRQKHELSDHMVTHSTEKPFSCALCGASFKLRRGLFSHMKTKHSVNQDNVSGMHILPRPPNMVVYSQLGLGQYAINDEILS